MFVITLFLISQTELFEPLNILKFADYLYTQGDFAASLNEYRRYLFLADSTSEDIQMKIINCLIRLERFDEAISETNALQDSNKRNYTKGWTYFIATEYDSSRKYLDRISIPYKKDVRTLIGLSYAYEFAFTKADEYLSLPYHKPRYKQPIIGALCALFPGGGHLYCSRIGDGLFSFFVISTSAILSYYYHEHDEDLKFNIALGTTILFYAGNIYGGVNAVRNYNHHQNEKYLQRILETIK